MPAVCVKDVDQQEFVKAFAAFLKKSGKVKVPSWADQVKTAVFKELSPYDQDWYYVRCASLARHLYMRGNAGVGAFRKVYGGSKDNGFAPSHFRVANGNIIRKCLQSLEAIKLVKKSDFRGRCVTPQGQRAKELLILSPSSPSSHDHNNSAVNTGNIAYSKISGGPIGNTKQLEYDRPKCPHYIRHCSIISPCCGMVFGCRLCHDEFDGQEMPFMKQMKFSSQDDEGVDGNDGDRVGSGSKKRRIEKEHDRRTNQIAAARCKSKGEMRQELKQECGSCNIGSKGQCMSCNVVKHGSTILSPPSSSSSDGSDTSTCRKGSGLPNKTRRRSSITTKKKKKNSRRFSMGSITSNVGDDVHHDINRFEIWEIICRNCFTRQSSKTNNCINCKIQFGEYHCDICNLWMESSEKPYHCNECGICRVGGREKYKHCDSCGMCIDKSQYKTHNCTAGKMMSNCPVCFEDLFSSRTACHELPCNHSIHWHCYRELSAVDIRCPICKKTTVQEKYRNELWSALREDIEAQPLPPDQTRVVDVSCTDCEFRESDRRWHPLGVDCSRCCSYNTSTDFTMVGQGAFDYLTAIEKTREGINMLDVNLREK